MKKFTALFLSASLALSSVAFAQTQSGATGGAGSAGATGAAGAGSAGAAAGAAAGVSVGVAAAVAAGVAVAAAVTANKSDPVYTTTNSGTGTKLVCIANC